MNDTNLTKHSAAAVSVNPFMQLAERARTDDWTYRFLAELTSEFGPRPAGSEAAHAAAKWCGERLLEAGFDEVHYENFAITTWRRGAESAFVLWNGLRQPLVVSALGGSVATAREGIRAECMLFDSLEALRGAPPGSLAGKIAVVTRRIPRARNGQGYVDNVAIRFSGASEAACHGAIGFLMRSLGTCNHRFAHTGKMFYSASAPMIPAAALSNPDADLLERLAAKRTVQVQLALASETAPGEAITVVAELKGRERPEEVVLLSGHLDSWDLGTGAIDDGAGVAVAIGVGKLIAELPRRPRRTIRIVLFGAEEIGMSGKAYAQGQSGKEKTIAIAGECDFGAGRIYKATLPKGVAASPFGCKFAELVAPFGVELLDSASDFGGPDLMPLVECGVPVVNLSQDGTSYFDISHTVDDTFDKVDAADLGQLVAVWSQFAWAAADSGFDFRTLLDADP